MMEEVATGDEGQEETAYEPTNNKGSGGKGKGGKGSASKGGGGKGKGGGGKGKGGGGKGGPASSDAPQAAPATPSKAAKTKMEARLIISKLEEGSLIIGVCPLNVANVSFLVDPESKKQIRDDMITLDMMAYTQSQTPKFSNGSFTHDVASLFHHLSDDLITPTVQGLIELPVDGDKQAMHSMTKNNFMKHLAMPCMLLASSKATQSQREEDKAFSRLCEQVFFHAMHTNTIREMLAPNPSGPSVHRTTLLAVQANMTELVTALPARENELMAGLRTIAQSFPEVAVLMEQHTNFHAQYTAILNACRVRGSSEIEIAQQLQIPIADGCQRPISKFLGDRGNKYYLNYLETRSTALDMPVKPPTATALSDDLIFPGMSKLSMQFCQKLMESKDVVSANRGLPLIGNDEWATLISICRNMLIGKTPKARTQRLLDKYNAQRKLEAAKVTQADGTQPPVPNDVTNEHLEAMNKQFTTAWEKVTANLFLEADNFPYDEYKIQNKPYKQYLTNLVKAGDPGLDFTMDDLEASYTTEFPQHMSTALNSKSMGAATDLQSYLDGLFYKLEQNFIQLKKQVEGSPADINGVELLTQLNLGCQRTVSTIKKALKAGFNESLMAIFNADDVKPWGLDDILAEDILFIFIREGRPPGDYTKERYTKARGNHAITDTLLKITHEPRHWEGCEIITDDTPSAAAAAPASAGVAGPVPAPAAAADAAAPAGGGGAEPIPDPAPAAAADAAVPAGGGSAGPIPDPAPAAAADAAAPAGAGGAGPVPDPAPAAAADTAALAGGGDGGVDEPQDSLMHDDTSGAAMLLAVAAQSQQPNTQPKETTGILQRLAELIHAEIPDFADDGTAYTKPTVEKLKTILDKTYNETSLDTTIHTPPDRFRTAKAMVSHIYGSPVTIIYKWGNAGFEAPGNAALDDENVEEFCNLLIARVVQEAFAKNRCPPQYRVTAFTSTKRHKPNP